MKRTLSSLSVFLPLALILWTGCSTSAGKASRYQDLVALFEEWREFQKPKLVDGVPDHGAQAMAAQERQLTEFKKRLSDIDTAGWTIPEKVDYHVVRAEMNGLDFDHRVRRPWARNPAFYVMIFAAQSDVPAHEGPIISSWIDLWTYDYPLSPADASELAGRISHIPATLDQARVNLVEDARDLWVAGIRSFKLQSSDLEALGSRVEGTSPALTAAIEKGRQASDAFASWLESEAPSKTGPSGVGKENYTWNLQNVHLVPYTWEEEVTLMRRELARAHAGLRLEEHRNRNLPTLTRVADAREYDRRFNEAVSEYMKFLEDEEILPIRDYMDQALRERIGAFSPAAGLRGFFHEVSYRGPIVMRTHDTHWIDLARMDRDPHSSPIRRGPLLYNIFDGRSEGLATGMEEMMMQAGFLGNYPRARELIWILLAQRAARALGGLYQHANEWTLQEAAQFASKWTPRGWLPADGNTIQFEQHFYLQQPGYGTSYLIGKIEIEQLMAERSLELGDAFTLSGFLEEILATGIIPVSLVRWELTGEGDQIEKMSASR